MSAENKETTSSGWLTWRRGVKIAIGLILSAVVLGCFGFALFPTRIIEPFTAPPLCDEEAYASTHFTESQFFYRRSRNADLVGHFGGGVADWVIQQSTYALARIGHELVRLDLSQPELPMRSGYHYLPADFSLLAIDQEQPVAIVALEDSLWSVDFSGPQEPPARNIFTAPTRILDVKLDHDRAYLHVEHCSYQLSVELCRDGLYVVDISGADFLSEPIRCSQGIIADIERSLIFGDQADPDSSSASIGNYKVEAAELDGIRILDSSLEQELGSYDPPTGFVQVASAGDIAYLAVHEGPLLIIDLSNPSDPFQIGEFVAVQGFKELEIGDGQILHALSEGGKSYSVIDISSSTAPRLASKITAGTRYLALAVEEAKAYLYENGAGIHVFDVATPDRPAYLATYKVDEIIDIEAQGNLLYVLTEREEQGELIVMDVSMPMTPMVWNRISVEDPEAVAVSGSNVFLLGNPYLRIYDIFDPDAPMLLHERLDRPASDLMVEDTKLYITHYDSGTKVLNVYDPSDPIEIATFHGASLIRDLDTHEEFLLIADTREGLLVVQVGAPY